MSDVTPTYRRLLRRRLVDICILIFIPDVVVGIQIPHIFPLFAIDPGTSLGVVSSQSAVASASDQSNRGAATGLLWMAGSPGRAVRSQRSRLGGSVVVVIAAFESVALSVVVASSLVLAMGLLAGRNLNPETAPVS